MVRALTASLSLAAALAVLPLSSALAADEPTVAPEISAEQALETAAQGFEARMQEFGERAGAISADQSLTEEQRETRIAALWSEYAPDVAAFTAAATEQAGRIAGEALAGIDIEALVADALESADIDGEVTRALAEADIDGEVSRALAEAGIDAQTGGVADAVHLGLAMAQNGAWAQNDPEQAVTYGLVAQYAMDQALADDEDDADLDADVEDAPDTDD